MKDKILKALKWFYHSYIWVAIVVFALDIGSKWIVQNYATSHSLADGSVLVNVIPKFWNIIISHNLGAAFSLGNGGTIGARIAWISISVIMSFGIAIYYFKQFKKLNLATKISLTLMLGGAVGNMIDRSFYWNSIVGFDGVIDWLDFEFGSLGHFATFNIADAALVIGVIILLIVLIYEAILDSKRKAAAGEYKYSPKELEEMKAKEEAQKATSNEVNKDSNE